MKSYNNAVVDEQVEKIDPEYFWEEVECNAHEIFESLSID